MELKAEELDSKQPITKRVDVVVVVQLLSCV